MAVLELSVISKPVRNEYVQLLQDIALMKGVSSDQISELIKAKPVIEATRIHTDKPAFIRLSVKRQNYPIDFSTEDNNELGRVFELAGPGDRNKTTSLIYIATLLGINWDEIQAFLDKENKVYDVAQHRVIRSLSQDEEAELQITSPQSYKLTIRVRSGQAIVSLLNELEEPQLGLDQKILPLKSSDDWSEYRKKMQEVCDVQFVGKNRDFIGQVTLEEIKDLIWLSEQIKTRTGQELQFLHDPNNRNQTQTRQEIEAEIALLTSKLREDQLALDELERRADANRRQLQSAQKLVSLLQELELEQNSQAKEIVYYYRLRERAQDLYIRIEDLKPAISELERTIQNAQQKLEQQLPALERIKASLEALRNIIPSRYKDLSILSNRASKVPGFISAKDYEQLLKFCKYALVDAEVEQLLKGILRTAEVYSSGLTIPIETFDPPGVKLNDLKSSWEIASKIAEDIQKLNPELTIANEAFLAAQIQTAEQMQTLEFAVEVARTRLQQKEQVYKEYRQDLESTQSGLDRILGTENFEGLQQKCERLTQNLPLEVRGKLTDIEQLAAAIGEDRPWKLDLSDIRAYIDQYEANLRDLDTVRKGKESNIDMVKGIIKSRRIPDLPVGKRQTQALADLQKTLGYIIDFLNQYKSRREEGAFQYASNDLSTIEEELQDTWPKVRQIINQVILQRSPSMYKNRGTDGKSPVKLNIEKYDFLENEFNIPNLLLGEWAGGGGDSAMTVYGLATRASGSYIGTVLLVDEFNDAETYKKIVRDDLVALKQLAFAIFVKHDPSKSAAVLGIIK